MSGIANAVSAPPLVVVMGVSGTGKSTVGALLARRLDVAYADGDSFHSATNLAKMAGGVPLSDADRAPWLADVGSFLHAHTAKGAVVSCSALRRVYRDLLRTAAPRAIFLHLVGSPALIRERIAQRTQHFMPASLLASQLAILEPLGADERGEVLDVSATLEHIVDTFLLRATSRT